ncbi:hypothetical protein LELO110150_08630 [Legionella longbeachae]
MGCKVVRNGDPMVKVSGEELKNFFHSPDKIGIF